MRVLALFNKQDVLDIDMVATYITGLQNEVFSGDMWGEDVRWIHDSLIFSSVAFQYYIVWIKSRLRKLLITF